ncbi:Kelch motif family protein [Perkinsela sp. CCAP 1560/4]|nr:Kelch motif family protein [Perkinsela sp. CCAP 1560/4]|eukprot:KNH07513.1 Kelch motif family protein [Perkinsela sp. CCAP 1560/4]
MWRAIQDKAGNIITFPYSTALECGTLSCVSVKSGNSHSAAVLLSIGGYGDEDDILGMYYTKIKVAEAQKEMSLQYVGESTRKSPWHEFHRDQILVCSIDGNCILCGNKETQDQVGAYTPTDPVDVLRVEGHTSVVVDSSQCAHPKCHCSLEDAILKQASRFLTVANSNLCGAVIDISNTVILFGGMNGEYELSNEMQYIRIASVQYGEPMKRAHIETNIVLIDIRVPQKGFGPSPRYRHAAVVQNGYHYVFGGDIDDSPQQGTTDSSTLYRVCLADGVWETLPSPCEATYHPWEKALLSNNSRSHSLASLNVLDSEHLILIGGDDFNGTSGADNVGLENSSWMSRATTFLFQRVYFAVKNALGKWLAVKYLTKISHCAVYNTRCHRWFPAWYRKGPPSGVQWTEVNGHVSLSDANGTVMWCFGKRNSIHTESLDEPACDARRSLTNGWSDSIDDRFTGDQCGEMHCISLVGREEPSMWEWIHSSSWIKLFSKRREKFVFDYTRKLMGGREPVPRGLYMAAECLAHVKIENPGNREYAETNIRESSIPVDIMLVMGGNRRHPDETIGAACWYLTMDSQ